jgi:integrase
VLSSYLIGRDFVFTMDSWWWGVPPSHLAVDVGRLKHWVGVPNVHAHRFRHSFALEFLRRGANVYALKEILGHSTMDMPLRYLALVQADTQSAHQLASPMAILSVHMASGSLQQ